MKSFAIILKITYGSAVRTRKGTMKGKTYQQVAGKVSEIAAYQAEADRDPHGEPVIVNIRLRELKTKTRKTH